jgi:hypothetical protein
MGRANYYYATLNGLYAGDPVGVYVKGATNSIQCTPSLNLTAQQSIPTIITITPSTLNGASEQVTIFGKNMSNATAINFYDQSGNKVAGFIPSYSDINNVQGTITSFYPIATGQVTNTYNVKVVTPTGTSNSLPFTVTAPTTTNPTITTPPATGNLLISLDSTISSGNITNAAGTVMARYDFKNTSNVSANVTTITLQSTNIPAGANVALFVNGTQIENSALTSSGSIVFTSPSGLFTIPANSSSVIDITINSSPTISAGTVLSVSITGLTASIPASAIYPISGPSMTASSNLQSSAQQNSNVATVLDSLPINDLITLIKFLTGQK